MFFYSHIHNFLLFLNQINNICPLYCGQIYFQKIYVLISPVESGCPAPVSLRPRHCQTSANGTWPAHIRGRIMPPTFNSKKPPTIPVDGLWYLFNFLNLILQFRPLLTFRHHPLLWQCWLHGHRNSGQYPLI